MVLVGINQDVPRRILIAEDDEDYAHLLSMWLRSSPIWSFEPVVVNSLEGALKVLESDPTIEGVLLDLTLRDESGLVTVRRVKDATDVAVVVLTGFKDAVIALEAISLGVQEYLIKPDTDQSLLVRALRYGIERVQLHNELQAALARESSQRELRVLERHAVEATPVAARLFSSNPAEERLTERFEELSLEYERLLDEALQERVYGPDPQRAEDLRSLAQILGYVRATPKDLIRLHTRTVQRWERTREPGQAEAANDEARMQLIQVMGLLAGYYRARSGFPQGQPAARTTSTTAEEVST